MREEKGEEKKYTWANGRKGQDRTGQDDPNLLLLFLRGLQIM